MINHSHKLLACYVLKRLQRQDLYAELSAHRPVDDVLSTKAPPLISPHEAARLCKAIAELLHHHYRF